MAIEGGSGARCSEGPGDLGTDEILVRVTGNGLQRVEMKNKINPPNRTKAQC